jgi:hypothetical protein
MPAPLCRGQLVKPFGKAYGIKREYSGAFAAPVYTGLTIRRMIRSPATAILDRLLRHSHVVAIRGDNYLLHEKRRSDVLQEAGPKSSELLS